MASAEDIAGSSTTPDDTIEISPSTTADSDMDVTTNPLTMENSLVGKLNEGRYYINKAGDEFQKCVERLDDAQMESIRQTHTRLVVRWWLCIAGGL
jgi:hypothetical protein